MKLSLEEKKSVFKLKDETSSEMVYSNLIDQTKKLPLQPLFKTSRDYVSLEGEATQGGKAF